MRGRVPALLLLATGLQLGCKGGGSPGPIDSGMANEAPTAPVISLNPSDPAGNQDLVVAILADSEDPDGDEVTYVYVWQVDGADTELSDKIVPAAETRRGEEWTVLVSATDGVDASSPVQASVTIGNTPPTLPAVRITPPLPTSGDTLTCSAVDGYDDDGDTVTYNIIWRVNNQDSGSGTTLDSSYFQETDSVVCEMRPFDGIEFGDSASATVEIQNGVPTAPEVQLLGSGTLRCALTAGSTDPEGHPITYHTRWEVDGSSHTGATQSQYYEDDTVPGTETDVGELWQCFMWGNDGFDDGYEGASEVIEIPIAPSDYYIKESDLGSELSNDCSSTGNRPYAPSSSYFSFSWVDEGSTTPTHITVDLGIGVECLSSGSRTVQLNGSTIGTYGVSYDCQCDGTVLVETISSSSTSAYNPGGTNTIRVTGGSTSHGMQENSSWDGGSYAHIGLTY